MNPPLIDIRGLSFSYGNKRILHKIDLQIPKGSFTCIVGPNGAGKTTLLKCVNRIIEGVKGRITLSGRPLDDYSQRDLAKLMSYVPQADERFLPFTVHEFVMMGRYPHLSPFSSISPQDARAVKKAMALTDCSHLSSRPLTNLSGGERQKVFVAAALAQGAEVLLLDEPTTFLDPKHQVEIYRTLKTLNRDSGITVVLVTHDINLACAFGDAVVALREGRVAFDGPAAKFMAAAVLESLYDIPFTLIKSPSGRPIALQEGLE